MIHRPLTWHSGEGHVPLAEDSEDLRQLQARWDAEAMAGLSEEAEAHELAAMRARLANQAAVLLIAIGFCALFFLGLFAVLVAQAPA